MLGICDFLSVKTFIHSTAGLLDLFSIMFYVYIVLCKKYKFEFTVNDRNTVILQIQIGEKPFMSS